MKKSILFILFSLGLFFGCQKQEDSREKKELQETIASYTKAVNDHSIDEIMKFWADDAVYINKETGEDSKGAAEIRKGYEEFFAENPNVQLTVEIRSLKFPSPDKAIEEGVATIIRPEVDAVSSTYTVDYIKKDGRWLMTKVEDEKEFQSTSHYNELKELEWMIGEWVDDEGDTTVDLTARWDRYKNFIIQHFKVFQKGEFKLEGEQVIGWDPSEKQIRSWVFDSDGGFSEGVWNETEEGWNVEYGSTLSDGGYGSSISVYSDIGDNSYTWESMGREIDGEILPNIEPVEIKRKR